MKNIIVLLIFCLSTPLLTNAQTSLSETFGLWSTNASWVGGTAPPTNAANIQNVNIDGFIRRNGDITSTSNFGLTVNAGDTLVIDGNLTILNGNVTVNNESVLLITGDVSGANFSLSLNAGGNVIFAGPEASISGITTNGDGNLYVFDTTPSITGNANGSNGIETEADLTSDNPDLFDFVNKGGVLPVELVSFKADVHESVIELQWTTASEINNDYFEVQKSMNGIDYVSLGRVEGNGNITASVAYSFIDASPTSGINYYRLKQVDFDGSYELSFIATSFFKLSTNSIGLFPNPAVSQVTIRLDSRFINTNTNISLLDMTGSVVYEQSSLINDWQQIKLPRVKSGVYIVRVSNAFFTDTARLRVE